LCQNSAEIRTNAPEERNIFRQGNNLALKTSGLR